MVRNGKIVVTDSGKRGVRTTGKTAVFNTNGECEECCGCAWCSNATPKKYTVVTSGIVECDCPGSWWKARFTVNPSVGPNGTFTLGHAKVEANDECEYAFVQACTGTYCTYPDNDCSEAPSTTREVVKILVQFVIRETTTAVFIKYILDDDTVLLAYSYGISRLDDRCESYSYPFNGGSCAEIVSAPSYRGAFGEGSATVEPA